MLLKSKLIIHNTRLGSSAQPTALYNEAATLCIKVGPTENLMHPQLYLHLTFPQETRQIPHRAFPGSKTKILGPPPTPKYT
ncbi:hypothetical protein FHG87_025965 [Trinorchestia longiramus]|nr:hypothetical protein FHG87_025965 [Trinorchestia longiramus]